MHQQQINYNEIDELKNEKENKWSCRQCFGQQIAIPTRKYSPIMQVVTCIYMYLHVHESRSSRLDEAFKVTNRRVNAGKYLHSKKQWFSWLHLVWNPMLLCEWDAVFQRVMTIVLHLPLFPCSMSEQDDSNSYFV